MDLRRMLNDLEAEVVREKHMERFEEARVRQPPLAPHRTAGAVVAALALYPSDHASTQDALCRCLVEEQRDRPHPLWAAMLVVAFAPMLCCQRARLYRGALPADDFSQLVLTTFLHVVASFPMAQPPGRTCVFLRQHTHDGLMRVLKTLRLEGGVVEFRAPEDLAEVPVAAAPSLLSTLLGPSPDDDADTLLETLVDSANHVVGPGVLRLVRDTVIRRERLRDYVRRMYPGAEGHEFVRIYQRLKRQRTRTLIRLRDPLTALRSQRAEAAEAWT